MEPQQGKENEETPTKKVTACVSVEEQKRRLLSAIMAAFDLVPSDLYHIILDYLYIPSLTWEPFDPNCSTQDDGTVLLGGNYGGERTIRTREGWSTGVHSWRITIQQMCSFRVGFVTDKFFEWTLLLGDATEGAGFWSCGSIYANRSSYEIQTISAPEMPLGSSVELELDLDARIWYINGGTKTKAIVNLPEELTYYPAISLYTSGGKFLIELLSKD